jgi:hypothetical protein
MNMTWPPRAKAAARDRAGADNAEAQRRPAGRGGGGAWGDNSR